MSNCENVLLSPICSWADVAYEIYNTDGHLASASQYGHEMYANMLENIFSNTTAYEETILCLLGM